MVVYILCCQNGFHYMISPIFYRLFITYQILSYFEFNVWDIPALRMYWNCVIFFHVNLIRGITRHPFFSQYITQAFKNNG